MIPWNINHFRPIKAQLLEDGVRYLHLKVCNFGEPGIHLSRQSLLSSVQLGTDHVKHGQGSFVAWPLFSHASNFKGVVAAK